MTTGEMTGEFGYPTSWQTGSRVAYYPPAPHIGHKNHLCDITLRGQVALEQVKDLVRDSKFICKKCGRSAANEENLCDPEPL